MNEKDNYTLPGVTLYRGSGQSENSATFTKLLIQPAPGVGFDEAINQAIRDIPHDIIGRDIKSTLHDFILGDGSHQEVFYALIIYDVLNKD